MRYYYEPPADYTVTKGRTITCDEKLYSKCTLYEINGRGLCVVQLRFNEKLKVFYYGPIDPWLIDDIFSKERFPEIFSEFALEPDSNGRYPVMEVRKLMWKLRMKPLKNSQNLQMI